jgi:hypothetical protein
MSVILGARVATDPGSVSSSVWAILGFIALAGALGGFINALLSDTQGFALPNLKSGILRPGFVGNVILGAFAAVVTWGLYGPLKDAVLVGTQPTGTVSGTLTVTALVGAAVAGAGGAKVVTSQVDKQLLRAAATGAAARSANTGLARTLATVSPSAALDAVEAIAE